MVFETRNFILSTALSITFMQCCKIVLMFYNARVNVRIPLGYGVLIAVIIYLNK